MIKKYFCLTLLSFATFVSHGQKHPLIAKDSLSQIQWVDEMYASMSLEERIGQLFMVSLSSNQNKNATSSIQKLVQDHHLGGVIFSRGGPVRQARLTNQFQAAAKIPLLIGMDAEWGLAMRDSDIARRVEAERQANEPEFFEYITNYMANNTIPGK